MGDPISLIMAALVAGAAKTAGEAVSDGYKGLKDLIKRKFKEKGKADSIPILDKYEQKPEKTQALLEDELVEARLNCDEEVLEAAKKVMEKEDPEGASTGKYDFRGAMGVQVGNNNKQINNW